MADSMVLAHVSRIRQRRTIFSEWQLENLKAAFQSDQYPDINARKRLAASLQLKEDRIQIWFQNRRARHLHASLNKISSSSTTSTDNVIERHRGLPSIAVNTRKRKSTFDVDDIENYQPPSKKAAGIPPSMSVDFLSRSSRSSNSMSSSYYQPMTSRDMHGAATRPSMDDDFLSRSSRFSSPSSSWSAAGPAISPGLTTMSPLPLCYAWPRYPYIFTLPY